MVAPWLAVAGDAPVAPPDPHATEGVRHSAGPAAPRSAAGSADAALARPASSGVELDHRRARAAPPARHVLDHLGQHLDVLDLELAAHRCSGGRRGCDGWWSRRSGSGCRSWCSGTGCRASGDGTAAVGRPATVLDETNGCSLHRSMAPATRAPVRCRSSASAASTTSARPLFDVTFCVIDLETTGGSPETLRHHRGGGGQGPGRPVPGHLPDPGQPRRRRPARDHRAHRHHPGHGDARAAHRDGAAQPARVHRRRGGGRPQRPLRPGLPPGRARCAPGVPPLRQPVGRHLRPGPPPGARRGARTASWARCRVASASTTAPATGPSTTRWPPPTCCTCCSSGRPGWASPASTTCSPCPSWPVTPRPPSWGSPPRCPAQPGVYLFRDRGGRVLYVGKATNLRSRVRSYFSGDTRRKVPQLLREVHAIDHQVCSSTLEAAVREVRLIHEHQPRFNRQAKDWSRYTLPQAHAGRALPPPVGGAHRCATTARSTSVR